MTQRRCMACGTFHDARDRACPKCDEPRPGFSKHLHTAKLNNHLYSQASAVSR